MSHLKTIGLSLAIVAVLGIGAWLISGYLPTDPGAMHRLIQQTGLFAPIVFILLQTLQVVVFAIPGEIIQVAGGMAFGLVGGTVLSSIGMAIGGMIAFLIARNLGRKRIERWMEANEFRRLYGLVHHKQLPMVISVIFFIPFLPKDIICYVAGLSGINLATFVAVSFFARIPSLLFSSAIGCLAQGGFQPLYLVIIAVIAVATILGYVWRAPIERWLFPKPTGRRRFSKLRTTKMLFRRPLPFSASSGATIFIGHLASNRGLKV
jgi:uncharacterized membrane protein YdjX (TVP38/TMEM64 family)